ncbi:MAG: hypothetical protein PVH18_09880, partial [Chloroflexota bacterium]
MRTTLDNGNRKQPRPGKLPWWLLLLIIVALVVGALTVGTAVSALRSSFSPEPTPFPVVMVPTLAMTETSTEPPAQTATGQPTAPGLTPAATATEPPATTVLTPWSTTEPASSTPTTAPLLPTATNGNLPATQTSTVLPPVSAWRGDYFTNGDLL